VKLERVEDARRAAQRILRINPDFTVAKWRALTPLIGAQREDFLDALRQAGIPEG